MNITTDATSTTVDYADTSVTSWGTTGTSITLNQPLTWASASNVTWSPYTVRRYQVNWSKAGGKHYNMLIHVGVVDDADGKGSEVVEYSNATILQKRIIDTLVVKGILEDMIIEKDSLEIHSNGLTVSTSTMGPSGWAGNG